MFIIVFFVYEYYNDGGRSESPVSGAIRTVADWNIAGDRLYD